MSTTSAAKTGETVSEDNLPATRGRWKPIGSKARGTTGYLDVFPARGEKGLVWVSIPGVSRFAAVVR